LEAGKIFTLEVFAWILREGLSSVKGLVLTESPFCNSLMLLHGVCCPGLFFFSVLFSFLSFLSKDRKKTKTKEKKKGKNERGEVCGFFRILKDKKEEEGVQDLSASDRASNLPSFLKAGSECFLSTIS